MNTASPYSSQTQTATDGLTPVSRAALDWLAAGCSPVPARSDGTKAPAGSWERYQVSPPTAEEVRSWNGTEGFGVVCGAVSGNLEMLEFEGRALTEGVLARFVTGVTEAGLLPLWTRVVQGYAESTPSGGLHVLLRLARPVPGNTKLTRRPETQAEMDAREWTVLEQKKGAKQPRPVVLVETRGEGGFTVTAPSAGRTHASGRAWTVLSGGPQSLVTITLQEREALYAVAKSLDQLPVTISSPAAAAPAVVSAGTGGQSWADILEPAGWTYGGDDAKGHQLWRRPGKADPGNSATTSENGGLYVFSSSTDFEPEVPYSKAAVAAVYQQGLAAADALATYGTATQARRAAEDAMIVALPGAQGGEPFIFDPPYAFSDQDLADACLGASFPWARYAADAQFWLNPVEDHWAASTADISGWVVTRLADYMPLGISEEKAKEQGLNPGDAAVKQELARFARRTLLRSTAGTSRVSAKMRNRIAVPGQHPSVVQVTDLDADPGIIWAGGTPWDIRKSAGRLVAADVDYGEPHLKTCGYFPVDMPTPLWDAYLKAVWPDKGSREWALRLISLGVTGYPVKAFPLLSGETDTGKTSFVTYVSDVLGSYATVVSPDLMTGNSGSSQEYARFDLKGVRLAFLDETPRRGRIAQEMLKALTGAGDLQGRPPYGKSVTFQVSHVLVSTANPQSDPPMTDEAVRNRIRLVPCYGEVAGVRAAWEALGPLDSSTWKTEAPGVLAQLIYVAAEVLARPGLVRNDEAPLHVQEWSAVMADEQSTVARWYVSETLESAKANRGPVLYEDYTSWCRRNEVKVAESHVAWGKQMTKLGSRGKPSNGVTMYFRKIRQRTYGEGF